MSVWFPFYLSYGFYFSTPITLKRERKPDSKREGDNRGRWGQKGKQIVNEDLFICVNDDKCFIIYL